MGEDELAGRSRRPVLGALLDPEGDDQARRLATALAADADAPVGFVDSRGAASTRAPGADALRGEGGAVQLMRSETAPSTGQVTPERVVTEAERTDAAAVTLQRPASESAGVGLRRAATDRVVAGLSTDVVVANGVGSLEDPASILVPVAGGPHTALAVRTARALARDADAWVELFHVVPDGSGDDARARGRDRLDDAAKGLRGFDQHDTWLYEAPDPATAIAEQSRYYDAVVMGAPSMGRIRRLVFGSTVDTVDERVEVPIVTAIAAER